MDLRHLMGVLLGAIFCATIPSAETAPMELRTLKTEYSDEAYMWASADDSDALLEAMMLMRKGALSDEDTRKVSDRTLADPRWHVLHLDLCCYYMGGRDLRRATLHSSMAYIGGLAIGDPAIAGISVYNLAKIMYEQRDRLDVVTALVQQTLEDVDWVGVQPLKGLLVLQLLSLADELMSRSRSAAPMRVAVRAVQVQWLVATRQFDEARAIAMRTLEAEPNNALVLNDLAISYMSEGRGSEAVPWWIRAVEAEWPTESSMPGVAIPSLPSLACIAFNNLCTSLPVELLFPPSHGGHPDYPPGGVLERRVLRVMRDVERTASIVIRAQAGGGRAELEELPDIRNTLSIMYAMLSVRKAMVVGLHWRYVAQLEEAILAMLHWCVQAHIGHTVCEVRRERRKTGQNNEDIGADGGDERRLCAAYNAELAVCGSQATGQWHPYWFVHIPTSTLEWKMAYATLLQPVSRPLRIALPDRPPISVERLARIRATVHVRTGICSYDFREHAFGYIVEGWLRQHDTARVQLALWSLSFWPHVEGHANDVPQTKKLQSLCTSVGCKFNVIAQATPSAQAALDVARSGVHIFVDAMGPTFGSRPEIVTARPAPVLLLQNIPCSSLTDDAITTDAVIVPPEALQAVVPTRVPGTPRAIVRSFTEPRAVYMPHAWFLSSFDASKAACKSDGRKIARDPATAPRQNMRRRLRFGALVALDKLDSDALSTWAAILVRHPTSSLTVLGEHSKSLMERLRLELSARGVHPSRLRYREHLGHLDHLAAMGSRLDLMLDPWVCNGHTTAVEALWAGVPLLTLEGGQLHSRVASSLLQASGEGVHIVTVAKSATAYEDMAADLLLGGGRRLEALRLRLLMASHTGYAVRSETQIIDVERSHRVLVDSVAVEHTALQRPLHVIVGANAVLHERARVPVR